jgi:uncharacterized LabA/DUF88 family protein
MRTFAFIDASNLFYGGEKSLGWKIDYQKLLEYLKHKYGVSKALYFGGIEIYDLKFNYLKNETVIAEKVANHLTSVIQKREQDLNEAELLLLGRHLKRTQFYLKLGEFGYELHLKPVKLYEQEDGTTKRKANCDVDMAFYLMKEKDNFDRIIVLSGDGDFLPVLKYLADKGKKVLVLSRGSRTAKEIRQFAGDSFLDFEYLRNILRMDNEKGAPI